MNKKLVAFVSLLLAFAMLFAMSSCSLVKEAETTTASTYPVKTPDLPTEQLYNVADNGITYYLDAEGNTLDDSDTTILDENGINAKNQKLFDYFSINVGDLAAAKNAATITRNDKKSIGKQSDAEGNSIKYCEANSKVNAAIDGLRKMMLDDKAEYEATDYSKNYSEYLHGIEYLSKLTVADVESATCTEDNVGSGERVITIVFKPNVTKELIDQNFGFAENNTDKLETPVGMDKVYEEFKKASDYMTIDESKTSLTYVNCTVTIVTDITNDQVKSIKLATGTNVNTEITGKGTLADVGTVPVQVLYNYEISYSVDYNEPETTAEK